MIMNYRLSAELYGNNLWMIDPLTFNSMWGVLQDMRNGVKYEHEGEKLNNYGVYNTSTASLVFDEYELNSFSTDSELVNIINLNGVITKNGGPSTNGTKQLANQIRKMDADARVKGHLIVASSGGGSGNAIKVLTDAINSAKKPVGTWIEHGEISCSACYGIISASNFIMAESKSVTVGSLGTMIEMSGRPKESKDANGQLHVRYYASKSTNKNGWFEEAMNGNSKPVIEELLNPANEEFLSNIKKNRPSIDENTQMDGSEFKAGDVLGTMVDSIGSFEDAINMILTTPLEEGINTNGMTEIEFKNSNPEAYTAIENKGVSKEKDRVGTWMAHYQTDPEAVALGVESGEALSNAQRERFLVKQNGIDKVANMVDGSAVDVVPAESKTLDQLKNESLKKEEADAFDFEVK